MNNNKTSSKIKAVLIALLLLTPIFVFLSCKRDHRLDGVIIQKNPFMKIISKPEVLLDHLNNPAAPYFNGDRIIFAESGKGVIYEYKDKKAVPLIRGFGIDSYGGYPISILSLVSTPDKKSLIVAASQDDGHIFLFDESAFPTTADKGREIELQRTEPSNPFGVLLVKKGSILVASGGTRSVYQGKFDTVLPPSPLKPVFDVTTGVEGLTEDAKTGDIFGAVVGTGQNDGSLIRWNAEADIIQPKIIAEGFTNLVGVAFTSDRLLLLLEFGSFNTPGTGRLSVMDPDDPGKTYPLLTGLDSPAGFALSPDNTLLISTFGKNPADQTGMLISLKLASERTAY